MIVEKVVYMAKCDVCGLVFNRRAVTGFTYIKVNYCQSREELERELRFKGWTIGEAPDHEDQVACPGCELPEPQVRVVAEVSTQEGITG